MEATNNLPGGAGRPRRPLKLVFGKAKKPEVVATEPTSEAQVILAAATRTSRTGRVLKAPTAFVPAPAAVGSGGKRRRGGKKTTTINCAECGRGHSPSNNPIVLCDGCESAWHKHCHNPHIPDAAIEDLDTEWKCYNCEPSQRRTFKAKRMRGKLFKANLAKTQKPAPKAGPHSVQASTQIEVAGNEFTDAEKRAWLSNLSHSLLVEMLVDISSKNPSVPIFPANLKELTASKFAVPSAVPSAVSSAVSSAVPSTRPLSAQSAPPLWKRSHDEIVPAGSHPAKRPCIRSDSAVPGSTPFSASSLHQQLSTSDTADESFFFANMVNGDIMQVPEHSATPALSPDAPTPYEAELLTDSEGDDIPFNDHRVYPKPGNGFILPSDPADLDILQEDPESKTFSHGLHGLAAKRVTGN